VCAAESRKKVVQRNFVRQIDDREADAPPVAVTVEEIVVPYGEIKQAARLDALRIVVVIFGKWRWYLMNVDEN